MTRESAGFFAKLFGKRSTAGQTVAPENTVAPTKDEKSVPPVTADSTGPTAKPAEAVRPGERTENADIDNAGSRHYTAPDLAEGNPGPGASLADDTQLKDLDDHEVVSTEWMEIPSLAPKTKVVTVLSLVPHAGLETLCAALEDRFEDQDISVRSAGPGLMRAAFAGALSGSDALVMVAPADPEVTSEFAEKLSWLEANGRNTLAGQSIFVVNYGSAREDRPLALPADLERPVVMLPFDNALSLPANVRRAPRRAARHAISQIVDELNLILDPA